MLSRSLNTEGKCVPQKVAVYTLLPAFQEEDFSDCADWRGVGHDMFAAI